MALFADDLCTLWFRYWSNLFGLGGWIYWPILFLVFTKWDERKRWPIRDLLDMAKGKLLQSASLPMVQWNHYSNWETVVKWQRLSQYFRIPRNTLCLSPRFCISFDPCKEIQESLGFWFPRRGFLISGTGFRILCPWNLDSGYQSSVDSRFLELYSRFQSPRFLILQAKISRTADFASKKSWIPESVFPYLGRISYCF